MSNETTKESTPATRFDVALQTCVNSARTGGMLHVEDISRILMSKSREVMGEEVGDNWAQVTKVIDERTLEARAHERGMAAYSAYLCMSAFAGSRLDLAERAYHEAYDLAMGRQS